MINVGDLVMPNKLARLAGYGRRDGGLVDELREDGVGIEARIGDRWWAADWLDLDDGSPEPREMLEHGRGRLGRGRR